MTESHDVFVPNGDSRHLTAVLLVGTAEEFGISQQSIKATTRGFFITEELAAIVYDGVDGEGEEDVSGNPVGDPETDPEASTTRTSGNRAAKNSNVTDKE